MYPSVNTTYAVPAAPLGTSSAASSAANIGMFSAPPAHTGSALSFVQAQSTSSLHPATPMTPATPAAEGSGIVPQLQ